MKEKYSLEFYKMPNTGKHDNNKVIICVSEVLEPSGRYYPTGLYISCLVSSFKYANQGLKS